MKPDAYPMHRAPRCTATSKRSGLPCGAPAVRGWRVCRMHGAGGGAKTGPANPAYVHGGRGGGAILLRRWANTLVREGREAAQEIGRE